MRSRPTARLRTCTARRPSRDWTHEKGGFYHDGRFPTLAAVVEHYDRNFRLGLTDQEKRDLVQYLKSL